MVGFVGPQELVIILAIVVLLFGAKKLPELARSVGKAKGEFHKGLEESTEKKEKKEKKEEPKETEK
jgi:sec-independent protein translocase protein TatA